MISERHERLSKELMKIHGERRRLSEKGLGRTRAARGLLDSAIEVCDELDRLEYFFTFLCDDWWEGWLPVRIEEEPLSG